MNNPERSCGLFLCDNPEHEYRFMQARVRNRLSHRLWMRGAIKFAACVVGTIIAAILCGWGLALLTR